MTDQRAGTETAGRLTPGGLAPIVAFLLIIVVVVGGPIVRLSVMLPTDLIYLAHPWRAADGSRGPAAVSQGPLTDTVDGVMPSRSLQRDLARDGELALWDPYVAGGTPLGAVPSSGFYNPMNLPYLVAPLDWAPALAKAVELAVAMGFTYLLARRLALSRLASTLAGAVYALAGFATMWTNWPQSQVAALIPAVVWGVENVVQRRTWRSAVPLALATAVLLLGGFPAVASHGLVLGGAFGLLRLVTLSESWRTRTRVGARLAGGFVAGAMLSAFAMLPFARGLDEVNLEYRRQTSVNHLPPEALVTTLTEKALGLANHGGYAGPGNQVEVVSFLGVGALGLAAAAVILRPPRRVPRFVRGFFAVSVLVLAPSMFFGGPPLAALQAVIPTFDMNPIGRARGALALLVAVLAGIGLDALRQSERSRLVWLRGVVVAAAAAGAFGYSLIRLRDRVGPSGRLPEIKQDLIATGVFGFVLLGLMVAAWLLWRRPRIVVGVLVLLAALTIGDSARFARSMMPRSDRSSFYPETPAHVWLGDRLGSDRFASDELTMFPNSNSMFRLRSANGHIFHAPTWKQALSAVDPIAFNRSPTFSRLHPTAAVITSPILDRLGARFFVSDPNSAPIGRLDPVHALPGRREIELAAPLSLTVEGSARGLVLHVEAKSADPGELEVRVSEVDGQELWSTRRTWAQVPVTGPLFIPMPEELLDGELRHEVELVLTAGSEITLQADPAIEAVRPEADGLRLVYADDVIMYERQRALPRIRWAGRSEIVAPGTALQRLSEPVEADTVLLEAGSSADRKRGGAQISVGEDGTDRIEVSVDARAGGHLVVADALQRGWVASLDGERVELLRADHAGVAVEVPAGRHEVVLAYRPPGRATGVVVSLLAAGVLGGASALTAGARRRIRAALRLVER